MFLVASFLSVQDSGKKKKKTTTTEDDLGSLDMETLLDRFVSAPGLNE